MKGSSIGVVIVNSEEELLIAIEEIFEYGNELLVEEYLEGVELTLPIIRNEEITVFPVVEITSERKFYDYIAGLCHHIIPARIKPEKSYYLKTSVNEYIKTPNIRLI